MLKQLFEIQQREGLSDNSLAKKLVISQPLLSYWKSGKRKPGVVSIGKILNVYPELEEAAKQYITMVIQ